MSNANWQNRVVVVGAGVGGLAAALELAARGLDVTVLERAATPGGKMREVAPAGVPIDAGPTVFTMRRVFEDLFAAAGADFAACVSLRPASVLARHAWAPDERLDLFASVAQSADAIGAFAGAAEARGYLAFCDRARRVFTTLDASFMRAAQPGSALALVARAGARDLLATAPFATLWGALGEHFADPRLRQLFGRYATYCGASPFLAPATLMLIAHVEQDGVWLVDGGMHRLAQAMAELAARQGAQFRYGAEVAEILTSGGRVAGVRLASGERIEAGAVVLNADLAALTTGLFGAAPARAATTPGPRSLSAMTWAMLARTEGFPLLRHTVFFSSDYAAEFDDIFRHGRPPGAPTIYVCAQDRGDGGDAPPGDGGDAPPGAERLLVLMNAPASGDRHPFDAKDIEQCASRTFSLLHRCGLRIEAGPAVVTTPADFHRLFPATGGALYGPAMHGAMAAFRRAGARTRLAGLYLAGGSIHPGSGVPMAALSGRQAAASLLADRASTRPFRRAAMHGGMSTR